MTDDDLADLAQEPEFYVACTHLERELIVRLSTQLELARRAA